LEGLVKTYAPEQGIKELRERLELLFKPVNEWCYQKVQVLPAIDEIEPEQEKTCLVVTEPYAGTALRPELQQFYEQTTWKNRIAFLTGSKDTYDALIEVGKRLKAIQKILNDLKTDKTPDNDPQMIQANDLWDTTQQIIDLLREKMKFTEGVAGDTFRKKCEQRLFTQQSMTWNEIKRRAATNPKWQWHRPDALDQLKQDCTFRDVWREDGGFVDKGPFPQPKTSLTVLEQTRDEETGKVVLRVTPTHADVVYWEVGGPATTASARLDGPTLETADLEVSLLAVDSRGVHETGQPYPWRNRITLKHRVFQKGKRKQLELRAAPEGTIRYTTDGSDPKVAGATYEGPFDIPKNATLILAYAERDGIQSDVERIAVSSAKEDEVQVDAKLPATWRRKQETASTKDSYDWLARLKKHRANPVGLMIMIGGESGAKEWLELTMFEDKHVAPGLVEECLEPLRKIQSEGQVKLESRAVHFETGQDLLEWVEEIKTTLKPNEVKQ
jgi:hypothetical protein